MPSPVDDTAKVTSVNGEFSAWAPTGWEQEEPTVLGVFGVWDVNGADVTIAEGNPTDTTDPVRFFDDMFGELGEGDGVIVKHATGTTPAGDPYLLVDMTPSAGQGGDSQSLFYVFTPAGVVEGAVTYAAALDPEVRLGFRDLALSVVAS